jgi:hypothetical protein
MSIDSIDVNVYYCGLAADELQAVADRFLELSKQAELADAHSAALHLADASTQLLDLGNDLRARVHEPASEFPRVQP